MKQFMFILSLIVCSNIWGQTISLPIAPLDINLKDLNQTDSLGKKDGYWCEVSDDIVSLCFYAGGMKNGFAQIYRKLGQDKYYLEASGYYCNNRQADQWLFFYTNGMVSISLTKISKNSTFLEEAKSAGFYNPNVTWQCYIKGFDTNGKITSEGWCIFQDDVEADAQEVGIWKYYTPHGIKTVNMSLELSDGVLKKIDGEYRKASGGIMLPVGLNHFKAQYDYQTVKLGTVRSLGAGRVLLIHGY